jgi:hypothetical protein
MTPPPTRTVTTVPMMPPTSAAPVGFRQALGPPLPHGRDDLRDRADLWNEDVDPGLAESGDRLATDAGTDDRVDRMGLEHLDVMTGPVMLVTLGVANDLQVLAVNVGEHEERRASEMLRGHGVTSPVMVCRNTDLHDGLLGR